MSGIIMRQYAEMLSGKKTLTRRLKLPRGLAVGKTRAVVPKRAKPAYWFGKLHNVELTIKNPIEYVSCQLSEPHNQKQAIAYLKAHGFVQARVEIMAIWQEPLCEMLHTDALAEAVGDVHGYMQLWNQINPNTPWRDDPLIWCIEFERTAELIKMTKNMYIVAA